jgi:hypothetical protein
MTLDPNIWGPHYWFVLHTIALKYPLTPNSTIKKKYYDFIQNIPLFIPIEDFANLFSSFLDKYPVTPYLDSRESLIKWMHFIHNKINLFLGKPTLSMTDSMTAYYQHYKPKAVKDRDEMKIREKIIFFSILCILFALVIALYSTPLNF